MRKQLKKLICSGLFCFLFVMVFQMHVLADSWKTDSCTASGNVITLTESKTSRVGGYLRTAAIDTRSGFTLSFDYCVSEGVGAYTSGPREGFQFILADQPIRLGSYYDMGYDDYESYLGGAQFCGLEMWQNRHFATVASSNYSRIRLTQENVSTNANVWYNIKAVYQNQTLTVYRDGQQILTCNQFKPTTLAYVGFTASTSYHARQKHQIRNVSISCKDAHLVNLNLNGGICNESSVYAVPNINNSFPTPERTGYTFKGWYTAASGGTKIINGNYNFGAVSTVYAQWTPNTYKVTLDANGGACGKSEVTVTYGSAYSVLPTPTKTGYTFTGWYTDKWSGTKVSNQNIVDKTYNQKFYARWTINTYKVTFKPVKGTLAKSKQTKYIEYSDYIWTSDFPTPKRKNYQFLGWYTKKSGGKKIDSSQKITSSVTYYAHWVKNSKKVTVKLNANKGKCSKKSMTVTYGGKMKGIPKPTRKGYTFQGWYTKKSGGTKVSASTKTIKFITESKTLYAHWSKKSSGSSSSSSNSNSSSGNKFRPDCAICHGSGNCQTCGGDGYRWSFALDSERLNCYRCNTSGNCWACHGSGKR